MLNNIGLPGLILIALVLGSLYFIIKFGFKTRENGEASKTKYILIWFLAGLIINIFTTVSWLFWGAIWPGAVLNPPSNSIPFIIFYLFITISTYYIFIGTYSIFKNLDRRKVIPYVWVFGIIGALLGVAQLVGQGLSDLYPNYEKYNIPATLTQQLLLIILFVRWINKNPGFIGNTQVARNSSPLRNEPTLPISSSIKEVKEPETPMAQIDAVQKSKSSLDKNASITEKPIQSTPSDDNHTTENSTDIKIRSAATSDTKDKSNEYSNYESPKLSVKKINARIEPITHDNKYLRDELNAACKFNDTAELLRLFTSIGFTVQNSHAPFAIKSPSGAEHVFQDSVDLIAFVKQIIRKDQLFVEN